MGFAKEMASKILETKRKIVPSGVKRVVYAVSPLEFFYEEPIAQVYIVDDDFDTFLCVNNFFSVLTPEIPGAARGEVELRGRDGRVLHRHEVRLDDQGSVAISVRELQSEAGIKSPVGLATLQLRPEVTAAREREVFKRMGTIASHFFTYYLHGRSEAMAIIHPQSSIRQAPGPKRGGEGWRSGQAIATAGLHQVRLYQANHAGRAARVEYALHDFEGGRIVASTTLDVRPLGADVAVFDLAHRTDLPRLLYLTADRLPAPNGKPLLMRTYEGGRFSMSHS
jgi:hypothetical protein